jgi:hypothetical protein
VEWTGFPPFENNGWAVNGVKLETVQVHPPTSSRAYISQLLPLFHLTPNTLKYSCLGDPSLLLFVLLLLPSSSMQKLCT